MTQIPLSSQVFHILLALAPAERHGYGIILDVEEATGGAIRLGPGTLYGALKRLVRTGWVQPVPSPPGEGEDERRRHYALTPAGRRILAAETARLASAVDQARRAGILRSRPT